MTATGRWRAPAKGLLRGERHRVFDVFALKPEIALAVAEQTSEARLSSACSQRLGRQERKNGFTTSGTIRPIVCALLRNETAGDPIRNIVEGLDRLLDRRRVSMSTAPRPLTTRDTVHRRDAGPYADLMERERPFDPHVR